MTVSFKIPELLTRDLRLRLPRMDDFETYAAFRGSQRSATVGGPFSVEQAFGSLAEIIGQWQLRGYGRWLVADRASDEPLGIIGHYHPMDWPEVEIGWSLFNQAEGRGVATQAAKAVRQYTHETLKWAPIASLITDENTRSRALAERLGCSPEDTFAHPTFGALRIWRHPMGQDDVLEAVQ
ncbi:MAG: GNAT family N-acetyltransferase [Pseudomonadota bacterium]